MKLVFSREDVLKIVTGHVANLLQCCESNLEASSTYHYSDSIEVTVLDQPRPIPLLHKVVNDFGTNVEVA